MCTLLSDTIGELIPDKREDLGVCFLELTDVYLMTALELLLLIGLFILAVEAASSFIIIFYG